jgi:hypothetical protein
VRRSDRWFWRGIGAAVVTSLFVGAWAARPHGGVRLGEPLKAEQRIAALRVLEPKSMLPDFSLWGAGPPLDLQWHVTVTASIPLPSEQSEPPPLKALTPAPAQRAPAVVPKARPKTGDDQPQDWREDVFYGRSGG